jgi:aminopeptidase N
VRNEEPIITPHGIHREPSQDQYFKGALFLNTLRNVVNDDSKWFGLIHDTFQHFKYQNIMTEDMVQFFNERTGMDLTPVFDQYLRHAIIPSLELKFDDNAGTVSYRWNTDEKAFAMPIRAGRKDHWQILRPTTEWQTMKSSIRKDQFDVATDLYYVNVALR